MELLELPTNMYKYVITIIGETSAPTQFKQGKNFNIIQALFFVITGDVVLKAAHALKILKSNYVINHYLAA